MKLAYSSEMGEWLLHTYPLPTLAHSSEWKYSQNIQFPLILNQSLLSRSIPFQSVGPMFAQLTPGCKSRYVSDRRD